MFNYGTAKVFYRKKDSFSRTVKVYSRKMQKYCGLAEPQNFLPQSTPNSRFFRNTVDPRFSKP